jgi:hypothetical protein
MRVFSSLAVVLVCAVACDRYKPLILCHNGNCSTPDVDRDDTLPALAESLALTYEGAPVLDGVELDTFWYGDTNECLFTHDLEHAAPTPILEAADLVSQYLASHERASWRGEPYYVLLDFKPTVGPHDSDRHTDAQLVSHAECVLDVIDRIMEGARAGGHRGAFAVTSELPRALQMMTERPRWATLSAASDVELMLVADIFTPYSAVAGDLHEFGHLDAVEYHPDFMTEPLRETYRSKNIDLVQWSFSATSESFDAIEHWEPRFAITNEGRLLRRWTEL